MKRITAFTFFLLAVLPLVFSASYRSNRMAQKIGEVTSDSDYILTENGDVSELYYKGNVIRKITKSFSDGYTVITDDNFDSDVKVVKKYQDGLLVEKKTETENGVETVVCQYHDGSLVFSTITFDGEEDVDTSGTDVRTEYYLRNATTGKLIGTKNYSSVNFAGTTYLIEGEKLYKQYSASLVYEDEPVFNEDGTFELKHGDKTYIFSERGDLISSVSGDETTDYFYDDDFVLIKQEISKGKDKTEKIFENGKNVKTNFYTGDILTSSLRYNEEGFGSVKTIMQGGSPVADIYYDSDNIRIIKLEYLD